jgi:DNA-directed RNA polymerase subunit RPC12/RpoP
VTPACLKCGHPYLQRSRRRSWERLLRFRAFRCCACSHRFLISSDVARILVWLNQGRTRLKPLHRALTASIDRAWRLLRSNQLQTRGSAKSGR